MAKNKALVMVDLQNDFCAGGSLAVPDADAIIPIVNKLQAYFDFIIATQDWHPENHVSFATQHPQAAVSDQIMIGDQIQILWPPHCIQQSNGAALHADLNQTRIKKIFHKGTDPQIDSYSAFYDNAHLRSTGLAEYLQAAQVEDVYLLGLATDYCVKFSALDAIKAGFNVYIIADACRGVELHPGDVASSLQELAALGAHIIHAKDIFENQKPVTKN